MSWLATCPWTRWWTTCRSTTSSPRSRARRSTPTRRHGWMPARRRPSACSRCSARRTSPRSGSCSSSTTRSSARARSAGRRRRTPRCCAGADGGSGALAVTIDGNGRRVACDPYTGAVEAVLECARNLACVGAEPLGLTNCLNFGNPEKPHIAWQLTRSVEGLRDACLALGVPVVGGNVSLYNEGGEGPIYPTPDRRDGREAAGAGGRAARGLRRGGPRDRAGGDVRAGARGLGAREAARPAGVVAAAARPGRARRRAGARCAPRCRSGELPTAHDVSDGGLACALAECCIEGGLGARVSLSGPDTPDPSEAALFGEGPGGVIVAGPREVVEALEGAVVIGEVGGDSLEIEGALSVPGGRAAGRVRGRDPCGSRPLAAARRTRQPVRGRSRFGACAATAPRWSPAASSC